MLLDIFLQKTSNVFAENRLLKFVVIAQGLVLLWCVYKVDDIKGNIRTIIQPPVINSKIEISGSWTSDAYVKEYIRYISSLAWNYSPGTARNQFAELLVSWHPSVFESAKQRLYVLADQIEKTASASVFYINRVEHNSDKHLIEVTGNRLLTMQDKSVEQGIKTYDVTYIIQNGRFWITGIAEKPGTPAASANPVTQQHINGKGLEVSTSAQKP